MSTNDLKVLGVAGSMRDGSYSKKALNLALESAKRHGAQVQLLELAKVDIPIYSPSSTVPAKVDENVAWADAFILASPDYHGSMSGALKNFLDYFYEEFSGKLFGYVVASHEKGLTVMDQMRTAVRQCYGWSLPYGVSTHGADDFDATTGAITNARLANRLRMLGRDVVVYGRVLREQFERDVAEKVTDTFAAMGN